MKYLSDFQTTATKPGNGGFYFSCYLGSYWEMLFDDSMVGKHAGTLPPHPLDAVWNQISVGGQTMRQAISTWWNAVDLTTPGPWLADCLWNPEGKPPAATTSAAQLQLRGNASEGNAPPVPAYTSRFFCNPTCRGYPWY